MTSLPPKVLVAPVSSVFWTAGLVAVHAWPPDRAAGPASNFTAAPSSPAGLAPQRKSHRRRLAELGIHRHHTPVLTIFPVLPRLIALFPFDIILLPASGPITARPPAAPDGTAPAHAPVTAAAALHTAPAHVLRILLLLLLQLLLVLLLTRIQLLLLATAPVAATTPPSP
jgi:hypothetical protein